MLHGIFMHGHAMTHLPVLLLLGIVPVLLLKTTLQYLLLPIVFLKSLHLASVKIVKYLEGI